MFRINPYGWVLCNYMDEEILLDEGYVLEANRQFFHPLGLELVAQIDDDGLRLRVRDRRDLPAGVLLEGDEELTRARRWKVNNIGNAWEIRAQTRLTRYGFVIQPPEKL